MQGLAKFRQGLLLKLIGEDLQQNAANERHIGQEVGMTRAGAIFAHQRVAPPVIADLHPAPVPTDQFQPLVRRIVLGGHVGEVIARLISREAGFLDRSLTAHHDQAAGVGEVRGEGFEVKGMQAPMVHAPMSGLGMGKKGVSCKVSKPSAFLSSLGWLPLIWNR